MQTAPAPHWVDVLFSRLLVRYGDSWARKWEGIPIDAVKADWQEQLGPIFERNPKAIKYALDHLLDYPPNSDAFLRLCLLAPSPNAVLSAPVVKPDPEKVAEVMGRVKRPPTVDVARECADRLRARRDRMSGRLEGPQKAQLEALEAIGK